MYYQISACKIFTALILTTIVCSCPSYTNLPTVTIGNYNPVSIAINYTASSSGQSQYIQYYFKTKIDELSSLQLTNISSLFTGVTKATATVCYQNASINFTLVDTSRSILRHFVSIVINLQDGVVSSVVGDNFCDSSCVCVDTECYESSSAGYGSSDGIFYLSWAGSDVGGTVCKSSTMRLSRYSLYSVSEVSSEIRSYVNTLNS